MNKNPQMFLVMDHAELPEHIRQTFRLYQDPKGLWKSELEVEVGVEGDEIDLHASGYIIIYAKNDWHGRQAEALMVQLDSVLPPGSPRMMIPVEVEEKKSLNDMVGPFSFNIIGRP